MSSDATDDHEFRSATQLGRLHSEHLRRDLPSVAIRDLSTALGDRLSLSHQDCVDHSADWWPITKVWRAGGQTAALPAAVAYPGTTDEIRHLLEVCRRTKIPVTAAAGLSGVCGQGIPVAGGIVLDMTHLNKVLDIDEKSLTVSVQPGIFGHQLESELNAVGYTLGHFPQSVEISTVGGWIACRSAGQYSTKYGKIEDLLLGLDVALARSESDGNHISFRPMPAAADGPDLRSVFLGSEGILGIFTRATLSIAPKPETSKGASFIFNDFEDGLEMIRRVMQRRLSPACLRLYDEAESSRHFGSRSGAIMVAISEGESREVEREMQLLRGEAHAASEGDPGWVTHWLDTRNDVSALDIAIERGLVVDTIEVAALWSNLHSTYIALKETISAVEGTILVSAHCSHAYSAGACLYFTFAGAVGGSPDGDKILDLKDRYYARVWSAAMARAHELGAALSHHHGIGILRLHAFNHLTEQPRLAMLRAIKRELDPDNILNPAKMGSPGTDLIDAGVWPPQT